MTTRSARTEVSDRISAFPVSLVTGAAAAPRLVRLGAAPVFAQAAGFGAVDEAGVDGPALAVRSFVGDSLDALSRRALEGDLACLAAEGLLSARPGVEGIVAALVGRIADAGLSLSAISQGATEFSSLCYALAADADADGRTADAIAMLAVLLGSGWGALDGCLGLAVIAARQRRFAEARLFAKVCMDSETRHPRVLSVIGICLPEEGDATAAQAHLAAAARLARTNPAFREDLQAAQRALLMMHLA